MLVLYSVLSKAIIIIVHRERSACDTTPLRIKTVYAKLPDSDKHQLIHNVHKSKQRGHRILLL